MLDYYLLLRSVLRAKPHLRACLTRCRHCRIFFLTHPRNAGRHDLGCPFGCKEAHRKQRSPQRSVAYYRGKEGQTKKRIQNGKRRALVQEADPQQSAPAPPLSVTAADQDLSTFACACAHADRCSAAAEPWPAPMVAHVRMVTSLMEGRRVSREEILEMLARVLRQHRRVRRRKIDQAVAWLNENPP